MLVEFAHFNKDVRSTARCPDILYQYKYDVVLKDSSSVFNPTIVLNGWKTLQANPVDFSYCRIADFNRCYFVQDVVFDGDLVAFVLSVDCLASFWNELQTVNVFVTRSQTNINYDLIDNYVQPTGVRQQYIDKFTGTYLSNYTLGFYVIGLINNDANQVGAVSYYVFNSDGFKSFCTQIFGTGEYAGLDGSGIDLATYRAVFNPMQYVVSAVYIPQANYTSFIDGEMLTSLAFGWYSVTGISNCWRLKMQVAAGYRVRRTLWRHPQQQATGFKMYNLEPYLDMTLVYPPYGIIPLDTTKCMDDIFIYFDTSIDPITGVGTLTVSSDKDGTGSNPHFIDRFIAQVGETVQLAQVAKDNYAYQTAVAQKNADVYNAMYGLTNNDIIIGGITGAISAGASNFGDFAKSAATNLLGTLAGRAPTLQQANRISSTNTFQAAYKGALSGGPRVQANVALAKAAGAESIIKAQQPQVTKLGNNAGGITQYSYTPMIVYNWYWSTEANSRANGYPCMGNYFIGDMRGYIQCGNVIFNNTELPSAYPEEKNYIKQCLEAGCYIE